MIFIASIIMGSIMFFAAEPLSRMMGADDELLYTSVRYLRTFALCSPLTTIFFAMDNYLRISGFVKTSMVINVCSNFVTVGLLTFFLIGLDMDVVGSALATSISMCLCSLVAIIPFIMRKTLLKFKKPQFSVSMFREIAACGSPVFLSNIAGRVTSILMNIALMTLGVKYIGEGGGTTAVAVYAVLMYSSDLCWPLLYGISDSLAPAIGYNWGAENYGRVKKIVKCNYIGTAVVGIVSTSVLFLLASPLASLFANANDVKLLELSKHAIRLFAFAYLFRWVAVATQSILSALEKPAQATVMSVAQAFVFPVAFLVILWGMGLDGIWLNFVGTTFASAVLGLLLMLPVTKEIAKRQRSKSKEEITENNCEQ
jgi:Na+-driven multidrug efflux pump